MRRGGVVLRAKEKSRTVHQCANGCGKMVARKGDWCKGCLRRNKLKLRKATRMLRLVGKEAKKIRS